MQVLRCDGIDLTYEDSGAGAPLVFLHGMGGSVRQIRGTCDPIDGVRLIALNQRGHGDEFVDWARYDFDRLGDDVAALLDHLRIESAPVAGISMGAAVALNLAARHPRRVRKLLLIRNAWTDEPMPKDVQRAYADLGRCLNAGGLAAFQKTESWPLVSASAYTRGAFTGPFDDAHSLRHWRKYLVLPPLAPVPSRASLRALALPARILACKNDLCHPYAYGEHLREAIPGAEFLEIPDKDSDAARHRRMINEAVRDFMRD